jgi:heme-degrading monooxygenase HmoA
MLGQRTNEPLFKVHRLPKKPALDERLPEARLWESRLARTIRGRCTLTETYTSGMWLVKEGEEDEFVAAWRDFASWGHTWPGCGTLRLVRDHYEPNRFMSFGPWESFEAQQAWKDSPEFKERIMRVRQHVEDFTPSVFEHVTAVE